MGQSANYCRKIPTWWGTLHTWVATTSMSDLNFRCMLSYDWTYSHWICLRSYCQKISFMMRWSRSCASGCVMGWVNCFLQCPEHLYMNIQELIETHLFPSFLHRSAPAGLWLTIEHVGGPLGELLLAQFAAVLCRTARCPCAQTCHATCNVPQGRVFEEGFSPSDRGLSEEEITAYLPAP